MESRKLNCNNWREGLSFTYTANGKLQIQVENFSKQLKTILMDKKLRKTTSLVVEIMSSKRQVKRKLGHEVQIHVYCLT